MGERTLKSIEQEREARKAALVGARAAQRLVDMQALNDLEIEHGDDNVTSVGVNRYCAGMVTFAVVRAPRRPEVKRFRDRTRPREADASGPAEEIAESCLLYPSSDSEEWKYTCERATGFAARVGSAAVHLAAGLDLAEGKE